MMRYFFGPMGHTEKCVSKAVEDVIQEEEMIKVGIIKSKSVRYKYWEHLRKVFQFSVDDLCYYFSH